MMVRLGDGSVHALDHREKAPLAATRDMYLDGEGNLTDRSVLGHLAAGVPGTVAGLWEAHRRFGTMEWAALVEPAIRLAGGFEVTTRLVSTLEAARDRILLFPAGARIFLPGGEVPAIGDTFVQPDLAAVLERLRDQGPDDFYRGETASLIAAEMARGGGIITLEDLDRYEAVWRTPVAFGYRGYTAYSMPPPSSGGVTMAMIAGMLERRDLAALGWNSPEAIHLMSRVVPAGPTPTATNTWPTPTSWTCRSRNSPPEHTRPCAPRRSRPTARPPPARCGRASGSSWTRATPPTTRWWTRPAMRWRSRPV